MICLSYKTSILSNVKTECSVNESFKIKLKFLKKTHQVVIYLLQQI